MKQGKLIILSAPSGTGKSTIASKLMALPELKLEFSVSATTRAPREGEVDGVNYYFLSEEQFREAIAANEFAEYQEVYHGRFYGTLKREIERIMAKGNNVLLDIDVEGAMSVKKIYCDRALAIFIAPPSVDVLRQRLIARGTDSQEEIDRRVGKAEYELSFAPRFDHKVINDDLAIAVNTTKSIIADFIQ